MTAAGCATLNYDSTVRSAHAEPTRTRRAPAHLVDERGTTRWLPTPVPSY